MKDRIKAIRKATGLTQSEFGIRIGVKGNTIGNYEIGLRSPSDAVIMSICREFNVSETWLRTGEGEMFVTLSRDQKISEFIGDILGDEKADFQRKLVGILAELSEDEWKVLRDIACKLATDDKTKK